MTSGTAFSSPALAEPELLREFGTGVRRIPGGTAYQIYLTCSMPGG
jgi:hypothetical protein